MESNLPPWMADLAEDDWQFIRRFLLASGSLKAVAKAYGISYPTIRVRLDRLIERIAHMDAQKPKSTFHRKVQYLVASGKLDYASAKLLIQAHEESKEEA